MSICLLSILKTIDWRDTNNNTIKSPVNTEIEIVIIWKVIKIYHILLIYKNNKKFNKHILKKYRRFISNVC